MDVENLRRHYALTLNHWVERYEAGGDWLRQIAGEKHCESFAPRPDDPDQCPGRERRPALN